MKNADIHNLGEKELRAFIEDEREILRQLRFQAREAQLKQVHRLRATKKRISQALTALRARQNV